MSALLAAHDHDISDLGLFGWIAVGVAALVVAWTLWRTVLLTVRPGEEAPDHIKRSILEDDPGGPPSGDPPRDAGADAGPTDPVRPRE